MRGSSLGSVIAHNSFYLHALEKDNFLLEGGVFTDNFLASYIELKREDVDAARLHPSLIEYEMYFDL